MIETLDNRIHEAARNEIKTEVIYSYDSFIIGEVMVTGKRPWLENQLERSHNISMLFYCHLPEGFEIMNEVSDEPRSGYLKWFDHAPPDLLEAHRNVFRDIIDSFYKGEPKWKM